MQPLKTSTDLLQGKRGTELRLSTRTLLADEQVLAFVRDKASKARFVTSVCTGSLVLGCAGLFVGLSCNDPLERARLSSQVRRHLGPRKGVRDGSVITAGGVTSGIDFGLTVIAELLGQEEAETIQLSLEYAPAPPFGCGRPETSSPSVLASARDRMLGSRKKREKFLA